MAAPAEQSLTPVSLLGHSCRSHGILSGASPGRWGKMKIRDSLDAIRKKTTIIKTPKETTENEDGDRTSPTSIQSESPSTTAAPCSYNLLCNRLPRGKAMLLVLVTNILASYAFGAAITGILNILGAQHLIRSLNFMYYSSIFLQHCASRMFYPIAGFIGDVYIGRHKMIRFAIGLLWVGYALITASFLLDEHSHLPKIRIVIICMRLVAFLLISAGGGGFEATIIPFGVDQLQGASSSEISSYFYYFYFGRNLAMVSGLIVYSLVSDLTLSRMYSQPQYNVIQPLISMIVLTVALVLDLCFNHWYFKDKKRENPVKLVLKVLCYAAVVKRKIPHYRKAFRYGEEKKPRIDLAKIQYDGKFYSEDVEDVKTFCRICLILISLSPTLASITAVNLMLSHEANSSFSTRFYNHHSFLSRFYTNIYMMANAAIIMISLPIINYGLIPCLPSLSIRARMGGGLGLYTLGNFIVVIIHVCFPDSRAFANHLSLFLPPTVINALAEVMTIVSLLEFIYAQSPESMKGLLTGLFFFVHGISSISATVVFFKYPVNGTNSYQLLPYHVAFTIVQILGFIFFVIIAVLHTNRQRPTDTESYYRMMAEAQATSNIMATNSDYSTQPENIN